MHWQQMVQVVSDCARLALQVQQPAHTAHQIEGVICLVRVRHRHGSMPQLTGSTNSGGNTTVQQPLTSPAHHCDDDRVCRHR